MKYILGITLLFAILISGCIQSAPVSEGLGLRMIASPTSVFKGEMVDIFIDVENKDQVTLDTVMFEVFDTGLLMGDCGTQYIGELRSGQFKSHRCILYAPFTATPEETV
ncbi:hypothetical protein ACFLQN_03610, partial [Candidatus Aenigmatarchaeota archaeon]